MPEYAVTAENLSFSYRETPVLRDVSFAVKPGEFIGIIGPNGGGKTTLLNILMGFLKPTLGKVRVFDKLPKEVRDKIAWVPQGFRFDRQFPISTLEVVLGGRLSNSPWFGGFLERDREVALECLEKVGMQKFAKTPFADLSGGQAQRVLIARALASSPELLLLDEPTAHIDAQTEHEIYQILHELKGHMTILMVTHNLQAVVDQVERVFCVQKEFSILPPEKVCEHFAIGLYHVPLIKRDNDVVS